MANNNNTISHRLNHIPPHQDPLVEYLHQTLISRRQKFHPNKSLTLNTSTLQTTTTTTTYQSFSELTLKPKNLLRPFPTTHPFSPPHSSVITPSSSNYHKNIYDDKTPLSGQLTSSSSYFNRSPSPITPIRSQPSLITSPTQNYNNTSANWNASRPSSSSSSLSSTDHHISLASPASIHPWPIPPTSAKYSNSSARPNWPPKSSTYSPLRTWSSAPRPVLSDLITPLSRSASATLAYLDLSSASAMSHRTGNTSSTPIQLSQTLENNCSHPASPKVNQSGILTTSQNPTPKGHTIRPISLISLKSTASKETFYEDAPDKAEWMEIDSGDAYDDLEKTEITARRMSESLSRMTSLQLAAGARTRYQALLESEKFQDFNSLFNLSAGSRSSHSPLLTASRQSTSSSLHADQNPLISSRSHSQSCASSKTSSSAMSHRSVMSSLELDRHHSTRTGMDRTSSGVPVFTRIVGALRDQDRGEGKEKESIHSIPGTSNQEGSDSGTLVTGSPSSLGGSSYKRRLKPLILKPLILRTSSDKNVTNSTRRSSSYEPFASRYSSSPESGSPGQPILCKTQSTRVSNQHRSHSSQRSSDDATLKEDSEVLSESKASGEESTPRFMGGQFKQRFEEEMNDPIMKNYSDHGKSLPKETVPEQASQDQIPVIKFSKQRSGTFGVHSSKVWAVGQGPPPLDKKRSSESLGILAVEYDSTTEQQSHENSADDTHDIGEAETTVLNPEHPHPVGSRSSLKKSLSPIKTQFFSSVRQRTMSHQSAMTGYSGDLSTCGGSEDSRRGSRSSGSPRHRTRCLSHLYLSTSKSGAASDRGVSPASYAAAAAKLADRRPSHTSELSGSPDTLIITGVPYTVRVGPGQKPESGEVSEPLLESKKPKSERHMSRLFMTLSRMQARDASKVLDLAPAQLERDCADHRSFSLHAQGHPKLIKGKLQRISKPLILQADDERVALWQMISNAKSLPSSNSS